jgi:hypothetical protein
MMRLRPSAALSQAVHCKYAAAATVCLLCNAGQGLCCNFLHLHLHNWRMYHVLTPSFLVMLAALKPAKP